ncbi:MAG TPA: DMT family transporter [Candidatus Limnocylindrales bacterium]|nr:DMT family transporter [Candidatus Limnocylindrales bacterium]
MSAPAANQKSAAGVALILLSGCCFGTLGIFGKVAYRLGLTTPQLLTYRFAAAAVLLWAVTAIIRQRLPSRRVLVGAAIMGAIGYVGQSASYFSALHFIPASTTALLLYTYPVAVTLLAALFFGEPLRWSKLVAVALAFLGTLFVVQAQLRGAAPIGIVLGLGAAAIYSAYILYGSRLLPGVPPVSATACIMTAAAIVWIGYAGGTGQIAIAWTGARLALLAGFVVIGTAVPVLAFIMGLGLIGASRAAILSTSEPASTVVLAVILLGESASPLQYLGGVLILASVVVLEAPAWRVSRLPL